MSKSVAHHSAKSGSQTAPVPHAEWVEADGLGGYAMGTVSGTPTRRYHALLQPALYPPTGRMSLVQGFTLRTSNGKVLWPISESSSSPGYAFCRDPWPTWTLHAPVGWIELSVVSLHGTSQVLVYLRLLGKAAESTQALHLELEMTGRDYHGPLLATAPSWKLEPVPGGGILRRVDSTEWTPPAVRVVTTGQLRGEDRVEQYCYSEETRRGLEDGEFRRVSGSVEFHLSPDHQSHGVILGPGMDLPDGLKVSPTSSEIRIWVEERLRAEKLRRDQLSLQAPEWLRQASRRVGCSLERSADQFLVRRGRGSSILAGFPWFTDWGRDTFIAMRGLLMASGRWDLVTSILTEWAETVSEGMLPNYFPDEGTEPEYNSVDAALWYSVCAGELFSAVEEGQTTLGDAQRSGIQSAVEQILTGYSRGTRFGIALDPEDGLLRAGAEGWQLTWMDARSDGREVTPRIGKPVEIQALWWNALLVGSRWNPEWLSIARQCQESFFIKFPDPVTGGLVDVVDADHVSGNRNRQIRPNQIFAVGGLPHSLVTGQLARDVVDLVQRELWTPLGLRSLSPRDGEYCPRYDGGRISRDAKYHQGTVWGWLSGPFIDGWLRVHPEQEAAGTAEVELMRPLESHLRGLGLGHITEVADGDFPHDRGGCPAQAWSLGEYLRVRRLVDARMAASSGLESR